MRCKRNAGDAENGQHGEHAGDVGDRLRLGDDDAHALLRAEEFGDDGAEQRIDDAHVEAGEDIGRGRRQLDETIGLEPRRGQRLHQLDPLDVGRAHAGEAVDQHREERQQRRHRHLRAVAEAAPDHDQRRDRDLGQALQREGIGHQRGLDRAEFRHQRADDEAEAGADQEAEQRVRQRAPQRQVVAERARRRHGDAAPQRDEHAFRRRQDIGRHLQHGDQQLPDQQQREETGDADADIGQPRAAAARLRVRGGGGDQIERGWFVRDVGHGRFMARRRLRAARGFRARS